MKKVFFLFLVIVSSGINLFSRDREFSYVKIAKNKYMKTVVNSETNSIDSIFLNFNKDSTFIIQNRKGTEMLGKWKRKGDEFVLTNQYYSEDFFQVNIIPLANDCNGNLPPIINAKGYIVEKFYIDANQNSYTLGDKIPYTELDTASKVRICSFSGSHCSDWFIIPYKDCYRFVIDIDINPEIYNGIVRKLYFKKERNKLTFIKSER